MARNAPRALLAALLLLACASASGQGFAAKLRRLAERDAGSAHALACPGHELRAITLTPRGEAAFMYLRLLQDRRRMESIRDGVARMRDLLPGGADDLALAREQARADEDARELARAGAAYAEALSLLGWAGAGTELRAREGEDFVAHRVPRPGSRGSLPPGSALSWAGVCDGRPAL